MLAYHHYINHSSNFCGVKLNAIALVRFCISIIVDCKGKLLDGDLIIQWIPLNGATG